MEFTQVAEISVSYSAKIKASDRPKISSSADAAKVFRQVMPAEQIELREMFYIALLSKANGIIGVLQLSAGGSAATVVDKKILFAAALKANAQAVILCHNHPSGNFNPSKSDIGLTKECVDVGRLLDMPVLDHIIITPEGGYFSFADNGLI